MTNLEASNEALRRLGWSEEKIKTRNEHAFKNWPFEIMHKTIPPGEEEEQIQKHIAGFKWVESMGLKKALEERDRIGAILKKKQRLD
jgi:hypothetical protein